jgi:plastocyanin
VTYGQLLFRSSDLYIQCMKFRTLVAVPFVALALVGCSSSGGGSDATTPAGATVITAIDGIAWDAKTYTATAVDGRVTIAAKNNSTLPHNLHLLDAENVDVGVAFEISGRNDIDTKSVALAPGTYQVICTITGHGNMKATLTVS